MATYKDIRGTHIKTVTSDPPAPLNGQMWYNSTTKIMKGFTSNPAGSWASGGALNTGGIIPNNGAGTLTAGLIGGRLQEAGPSPGNKANTEQYNGTSFSEVNDLNTARSAGAMGGLAYTSALWVGGQTPPLTGKTESWNGSSWTEVNDLNLDRRYFGGSIESTSGGLVYGGITPSASSGTGQTEQWNGSSWTEVHDLNNARRSNRGVGTSSQAFAMGGYDGTSVSFCENWNGSSWTETTDQNDAGGGACFGAYSDALKTSGQTTELWNGSAWSSGSNASSPTGNRSGVGANTNAGFKSGGEPPNSGLTITEEWIAPTTSTVTFTAS